MYFLGFRINAKKKKHVHVVTLQAAKAKADMLCRILLRLYHKCLHKH